jgi:hypothetical protein
MGNTRAEGFIRYERPRIAPLLAMWRGGFIDSGDFYWMRDMAAMAEVGAEASDASRSPSHPWQTGWEPFQCLGIVRECQRRRKAYASRRKDLEVEAICTFPSLSSPSCASSSYERSEPTGSAVRA